MAHGREAGSMTLDELHDTAVKSLQETPDAGMTLVFQKGYKFLPKFPRGRLLCINSDGSSVRNVSPKKLIQWVKAVRKVLNEDQNTI